MLALKFSSVDNDMDDFYDGFKYNILMIMMITLWIIIMMMMIKMMMMMMIMILFKPIRL